MDISIPQNFSASKTRAKPGDSITFTWEPSTATGGTITSYFVCIREPGSTIFLAQIKIEAPKTICTYVYPESAPAYILATVSASAFYDDGGGYLSGEESNEVKIYLDDGSGGTPTPPVTVGRLEQFQNSAGEQIYPRTIIEGIFRQSDSKPLSEILAGLGGVTMGQVNEAIASAIGTITTALSEV